MDLNQIENCINAILTGNDEERNEASQFLSNQSQDTNFSYLLAQTIANDQVLFSHRLLCLIIFIRLNVIFPPDLFQIFLPLFNTPDIRFSNQLAVLLSNNITDEEQISLILESSENASLSYLYGILTLLTEILLDRSILPSQIFLFCTKVITETQTQQFDESDAGLFMKVRDLASKSIDLILAQEDCDPDPSFIQFLTYLITLPVNEERNIPIISNILKRASEYLPETEFFNIGFQHLINLSEMAPLSGQLINLAYRFCSELYITYKYRTEDIDFDHSVFISSIIQCCILNSEIIDRWKSNINEFLIEEIIPEEYGDVEINENYNEEEDNETEDVTKYDIVYLRDISSQFANKGDFFNEAIEICTQMMRASPYHMETAFFFLSSIVPSNYAAEIDLACPDDEEPILYGQYIYTLAALNYPIDAGTLDDCIESDNDFLILFLAKAIFESGNEVFINYVVPVTMKLLNMTYMYEFPECSAFLEMIFRLIKKDKLAFVPLLENLLDMIFKILQATINYKMAAVTIFKILSAFSNIPECSLFIQESTLPIISELLSSENSYLILCSFDLMAQLFAPLETSILPYESIEPIFEIFMKIIIESLSSPSSSQFITIDSDSMDSIMTLLAFFPRSYSPSPFATPICQLLSNVLVNFEINDSNCFIHLPSCVVHSFLNTSEDEVKAGLINALNHRLVNEQEKEEKQNYFLFNLALSLSTLSLIDTEFFVKCIDASEIDIRILITSIAAILENSHEKIYFDDLIIIAALFKFGDLVVVDFEEEKPFISVALRVFFSVFYNLFDRDEIKQKGLDYLVNIYKDELNTYFSPDDPFFLNHHIRSISFIEFISEVLPPLDQIPPYYQKNMQEDILNH